MLVRTPEEIFRSEKKDLIVISSQEGSEEDRIWGRSIEPEGLRMIRDWIRNTMPDVKQELLGPSEYSGFISGGIGNEVRVDFSLEQMKIFCDRWEVNDKSIDPRFQCYILPYQVWLEEHGRFIPTKNQPDTVGVNVWWYTPQGFIHHQLDKSEVDAHEWNSHPANKHDIWANAISIWPELAELNIDCLTYGNTYKHPEDLAWTVIYVGPSPWVGNVPLYQPTDGQIRNWFRLPENAYVVEDRF